MTDELQQKKHFERPTIKKQSFTSTKVSFYFIGMVVISLLGGAIGFSVMAVLYPSVENYDLPYQQGIKPSAYSIESPLSSYISHTDQFLVGVFKKRAKVANATTHSNLIDPAGYLGSGVVLTSDGWILLDRSDLSGYGEYEVLKDGRYYEVSDYIVDSYTDVVFLKIEAQGLGAVEYFSDPLVVGDQLIYNKGSELANNRFGTVFVGSSVVFSSEDKYGLYAASGHLAAYEKLVTVSQEDGFLPAPIFSSDGKFAGLGAILSRDAALISSSHIKVSLELILSEKEDLDLGVRYVDARLDAGQLSERFGIIITHPTLPSIIPGSIAEESGLQKGDLIIGINGESVSSGASFEILWRKNQHEDIRLQIERLGQELYLDIPA